MILLPPPLPPSALRRLRLGWKRLRLLDRARRKAREIVPLADRTALIRPGDILAVAVMRNEALRLSHWLAHHRRMGVDRFLIVDNGSEDGTRERLMAEPDVSLWSTAASYRASRFGMDWANALLGRFGRGHWCLTLDADELLIFPHWEERGPARPAGPDGSDGTGGPALSDDRALSRWPAGQRRAAGGRSADRAAAVRPAGLPGRATANPWLSAESGGGRGRGC
ncbi:Glycosyl transferase family 2 [Rubellimicrobium thermophilum DSM 16684]|uniref:Glycosyl transferase family 2 n=1 Tax=Rubellimicrobium thermophilum DSM 16684 TaxID=1123069 RepID=S9SMP0_9RHOB|nr:glycosyltransferase family 2 protein [Rubellimicrobium thermophilum]EPX87669.1 Glycosyl transferase family 2 [Rubellimicrobium thermophilum DSM 16684]